MGLLGVGLVATLWLSTAAAADSYRLQDARAAARMLSSQSERLHREVANIESAPELARRAAAIGMVPVQDPARLVVARTGRSPWSACRRRRPPRHPRCRRPRPAPAEAAAPADAISQSPTDQVAPAPAEGADSRPTSGRGDAAGDTGADRAGADTAGAAGPRLRPAPPGPTTPSRPTHRPGGERAPHSSAGGPPDIGPPTAGSPRPPAVARRARARTATVRRHWRRPIRQHRTPTRATAGAPGPLHVHRPATNRDAG